MGGRRRARHVAQLGVRLRGGTARRHAAEEEWQGESGAAGGLRGGGNYYRSMGIGVRNKRQSKGGWWTVMRSGRRAMGSSRGRRRARCRSDSWHQPRGKSSKGTIGGTYRSSGAVWKGPGERVCAGPQPRKGCEACWRVVRGAGAGIGGNGGGKNGEGKEEQRQQGGRTYIALSAGWLCGTRGKGCALGAHLDHHTRCQPSVTNFLLCHRRFVTAVGGVQPRDHFAVPCRSSRGPRAMLLHFLLRLLPLRLRARRAWQRALRLQQPAGPW